MIPALTQNRKVGRGGDNCPRLNMMSSNAAGPKYMVCMNNGKGHVLSEREADAPPQSFQQQNQYSVQAC